MLPFLWGLSVNSIQFREKKSCALRNCQFILSAPSDVLIFSLSFFDEASKNPDSLSFLAKNGLEFFRRLSFFGLEFFENAQKISLVYDPLYILCSPSTFG